MLAHSNFYLYDDWLLLLRLLPFDDDDDDDDDNQTDDTTADGNSDVSNDNCEGELICGILCRLVFAANAMSE